MKSDLEHSRRTQSLQLTAHSLQIFGMPFLNPTEIGLRELHRIKLAIYRGREASGKAVPEKGGCLAASQPLGESGHKLNSVTEAPNLAPGLEYPSSAALGRRQPHPPGGQSRGWAQTTAAPPSCGVASPPDVKAGGGEPGATPSRTEGCLLDTMVWNHSRF